MTTIYQITGPGVPAYHYCDTPDEVYDELYKLSEGDQAVADSARLWCLEHKAPGEKSFSCEIVHTSLFTWTEYKTFKVTSIRVNQ